MLCQFPQNDKIIFRGLRPRFSGRAVLHEQPRQLYRGPASERSVVVLASCSPWFRPSLAQLLEKRPVRRELGIDDSPAIASLASMRWKLSPAAGARSAPSPPRLLVRELAGVGKHPHLAQEVRAEAEFWLRVRDFGAGGVSRCRKGLMRTSRMSRPGHS